MGKATAWCNGLSSSGNSGADKLICGGLTMNNDIRAALMGDKEAAKRLTEAGVLLPCSFYGGNR